MACGGKIPPKVERPTFSKPPTTKVDPDKTYLATFQTSCGDFTVRLDPKKAPITTANFVFLAGKKFYDSTWFHRIVPGGAAGIAVIQGGDPQGTGQGGPGYAIKDELPSSPAAYKQYSVAMANSGPDSGGSQFFINFEDNSKGLQPNYSVFGEVVDGRDVVDKIAQVQVGGQTGDTPAAVGLDREAPGQRAERWAELRRPDQRRDPRRERSPPRGGRAGRGWRRGRSDTDLAMYGGRRRPGNLDGGRGRVAGSPWCSGGHAPLVLGGDCTITLGVVAGSHGASGLLYFDGDATCPPRRPPARGAGLDGRRPLLGEGRRR